MVRHTQWMVGLTVLCAGCDEPTAFFVVLAVQREDAALEEWSRVTEVQSGCEVVRAENPLDFLVAAELLHLVNGHIRHLVT